jgi:hypothetical protein
VNTQVFKLLLFLKRKPGMSLEAFRDYYENVHAKLGEKFTAGIVRYARRYVQPPAHPLTGVVDELEFDVITEIWFSDRAIMDDVIDKFMRDAMPDEVKQDELRMFDRSKHRCAVVTDFESSSTHAASRSLLP